MTEPVHSVAIDKDRECGCWEEVPLRTPRPLSLGVDWGPPETRFGIKFEIQTLNQIAIDGRDHHTPTQNTHIQYLTLQ